MSIAAQPTVTASSTSISASLSSHDVALHAVSSLTANAKLTRNVALCAERLSEGRFWNQRTSQCELLPGWHTPLLPFEASFDELSCVSDWRVGYNREQPDKNKKNKKRGHKSRGSSNRWFRFAFSSASLRPADVIGKLFFTQVVVDNVAPDDMTLDRLAVVPPPSSSSSSSAAAAAAADTSQQLQLFEFTDDSDAPLSLPSEWRKIYSRFIFFTSFLLPSYLPWRPTPVQANVTILPGNIIPNAYRAGHDGDEQAFLNKKTPSPSSSLQQSHSSDDRMYRIENVCISPFDGLSGFFPAGVKKYRGAEDTRKFYHQMVGLPRLLSDAFVRRTSPPLFLDQRLAIFFPLIQHSRWNLAHTQLQILSLLGMVNQLKSENRHSRNGLSPLIVGVYDLHWSEHLELNRTAAIAFFFRIIDLPYAGIMSDAALSKADQARLPKIYKQLARHATSGNDVLNRRSGSAEVCFRRAVAWMNCWGPRCDLKDPETEIESFSFGQWTRPNSFRVKMVSDLVKGLDRCLPLQNEQEDEQQQQQQSVENGSGASHVGVESSTIMKPRVFFDLRTGTVRTPFSKLRAIRSLGAFADVILEGIEGYVLPVTFDTNSGGDDSSSTSSNEEDDDNSRRRNRRSASSGVIFAEPWRGSRAQYLNNIRSSNIFIGVHGASFSQTVFMPQGDSVVVELTLPHLHPHRMRPDSWFGVYTRIRKHDHYFFELMNTSVMAADRRGLLGSVNNWDEMPTTGAGGDADNEGASPMLQAPKLRWTMRGIGLKDVFSIAPQFLIDVIKVAACRWMTRHHQKSALPSIDRMCRDSREVAAACQRLKGIKASAEQPSSSATSGDCINFRTLHYIVDERIYSPYMVQAVFRSFFGLGNNNISLSEAERIATHIRAGLTRTLQKLADTKIGAGTSFSAEMSFLEFSAEKHLRLESTGAARMTLLWKFLVNHLGDWDHGVHVTARVGVPSSALSSSGNGDDENHLTAQQQQDQEPDCCLVLDGIRRTCLYISARNINDV